MKCIYMISFTYVVVSAEDAIVKMNVPAQLQPLSVDTDIIYDLDMSKFPGVDDPRHMFHPALVISTPETRQFWLQCMIPSGVPEIPQGNIISTDTEDLYSLIDSCQLELSTMSDCDDAKCQDFFEDMLDSNVNDGDLFCQFDYPVGNHSEEPGTEYMQQQSLEEADDIVLVEVSSPIKYALDCMSQKRWSVDNAGAIIQRKERVVKDVQDKMSRKRRYIRDADDVISRKSRHVKDADDILLFEEYSFKFSDGKAQLTERNVDCGFGDANLDYFREREDKGHSLSHLHFGYLAARSPTQHARTFGRES